MRAVPLVGTAVGGGCRCIHHLRHGALPEVQEHASCIASAGHGLPRSRIGSFQLAVVHSLHCLVRGIEDAEAILVRYSPVGRVRHRMVLVGKVVLWGVNRACTLWTLFGRSLHQLVRILVAVPQFIIYVYFSISKGFG